MTHEEYEKSREELDDFHKLSIRTLLQAGFALAIDQIAKSEVTNQRARVGLAAATAAPAQQKRPVLGIKQRDRSHLKLVVDNAKL